MSNPPPAADSLPDDELMALWAQARALALRCCGRSLARLRAGQGGFFQEDDLWQELFLEFWGLARAWRSSGSEQAALWEEWLRRLSRSGARVLQRAPQRLWARAEHPTEPERLALVVDGLADRDEATATSEPAGASAIWLDGSSRWLTSDHAYARGQALRALYALDPVNRQMVYQAGMVELPCKRVARDLGLPSAHAVHQRVSQARRAMQEALRKPSSLDGQVSHAPAWLAPAPASEDHLLAALDQERCHLAGLIQSGYSLDEAARWLAAWQGW